MQNTIQFSPFRKCQFSELHTGDFFLVGNTLYVKLGANLAASFLVGSPLADIDANGDPTVHQMIIVSTNFPLAEEVKKENL